MLGRHTDHDCKLAAEAQSTQSFHGIGFMNTHGLGMKSTRETGRNSGRHDHARATDATTMIVRYRYDPWVVIFFVISS